VKTGKDRATIANAVRLLRLEKPILELIEDGRVSAGHGRALLSVTDPKLRIALAQKAARGGMTVRQIERFASRKNRAPVAEMPAPQLDANTRAALEELQQSLGTRVRLTPPSGKRAGELIIEYYDEAQLTGIYDQIMNTSGS